MKTIAAKQLAQYLQEHPQTLLVDLRTPQAYKAGHVRGAVNIPYGSRNVLEEPAGREKEWIFYCQRGGSAMAEARRFSDAGWNAMAVIGGYEDISRLTETVSAYKI